VNGICEKVKLLYIKFEIEEYKEFAKLRNKNRSEELKPTIPR
jgi:hypothetical protein